MSLKELLSTFEEENIEVKEKTKNTEKSEYRYKGIKDGKTGKTILSNKYAKITITSEVPLHIGTKHAVIDEEYFVEEKTLRKLIGSSSTWLKKAHKVIK
jgi:hypothetical protein